MLCKIGSLLNNTSVIWVSKFDIILTIILDHIKYHYI